MRILITGASGFIGNHLTQYLLNLGNDVAVVLRPQSKLLLQAKPMESSLIQIVYDGSIESLITSVKAFQPELVVHTASLFIAEHKSQQITDLISSNVLFGTHILEAMTLSNCTKLVNIGTSWQHYHDEKYNPVCLYAATKQAFEDIAQFYLETKKLSITTLKLFDTFGPNDRRAKIVPYLLSLKNKKKQKLDMSPGDQFIDLVYITDVLTAIHSAINRLQNGQDKGKTEFAVSSGHPIRLRELVDLLIRLSSIEVDLVWGGRPYRENEVMTPWSTENRIPGWTTKVKIEEGLKRIIGTHVQT